MFVKINIDKYLLCDMIKKSKEVLKMAKLIIELDEELKQEFIVVCAKKGKTQKEIITAFVNIFVNRK